MESKVRKLDMTSACFGKQIEKNTFLITAKKFGKIFNPFTDN